MDRKALGRGLGALIPQRESSGPEVAHQDGERIVYADPQQIKPNPFQPREEFDDQSLAELAQSIKEKGVIQPLLVRRSADGYELVAGERRLRAVKILGLEKVPVIVREIEDQDSLELALIENIQRQDLNPIEEAKAYQYLIDKFQITQEKISQILGKARVSITNTLRLLRLPKDIQAQMRQGRIPFAHGRALLEVQDEQYQRRLAGEIVAKGLSLSELDGLIRARRLPSGRRIAARGAAIDPYTAVLVEQLQQVLATKVRVQKKTKRGTIIIEFYSPEDLKRIAVKIVGGA